MTPWIQSVVGPDDPKLFAPGRRTRWPWIPGYLDGERYDELRLELARKAIAAGLDGRVWEAWLRRKMVPPAPTGHPSSVYAA